jgi:hypothetical protein
MTTEIFVHIVIVYPVPDSADHVHVRVGQTILHCEESYAAQGTI